MSPKFSIIIPVYNVAPWLRECLDSVLAQTCRDWECICVDDGSTDGSGDILDEYEKKVEKLGGGGQRSFKVMHQKNAGVSAARNAAMQKARGEWILFVDGDDCMQPTVLARSLAASEKCTGADLISLQLQRFESVMPELDDSYSEDCAVDISKRIPYVVDENGFWQFVYRNSLIANLRFPPYVMGEDRLFKTWALVRARKLVQMDGVAYCYRCRAGSAIESPETWRKWRDDMCHSVRRLWALFFCCKHVEWRIYRHQFGLLLRMLQRVSRIT